MASAPTPAEKEPNAYELLGVSDQATEAEIRTAYRSRSLKVHPDRNRNDPKAAQKFHELTLASALLLDPLRRLALDAQLRAEAAKKARFSSFDKKRREMVADLEEREQQAVKRARVSREERQRREYENDRIMEQGKRLREERERASAVAGEQARREREEEEEEEEDVPPPLGALDTTVRIKYAAEKHPELDTGEALAAHVSRIGAVDKDSVVMSKKAKKKKSKAKDTGAGEEGSMIVTALVPFAQLASAYAAVTGNTLLDMEVAWAGGSEPPILGWLRKRGALGGQPKGASSPAPAPAQESTSPPPFNGANGSSKPRSSSPHSLSSSSSAPFSSFPSTFPDTTPSAPSAPPPTGLDFESMTLLRMREAERARLEREILEAEANEG